MTVLFLSVSILVAALQPAAPGPETFAITGTMSGSGAVAGGISVAMALRIDRYTPEHARTTMTDALKYRGYPGFLLALRDSPVAGTLTIGEQSFTVRWAHSVAAGPKRVITIVTDQPVFFFGARKPDAKNTAGYEVALMRIEVDADGKGDGTFAAAARVKPDGSGGIVIDQYAETPMRLAVTRPAK